VRSPDCSSYPVRYILLPSDGAELRASSWIFPIGAIMSVGGVWLDARAEQHGLFNTQGIFLQLFSWDSRCLQVRLEEAQDLLIGINLVLSEEAMTRGSIANELVAFMCLLQGFRQLDGMAVRG
jgi:hypothetical protein